MQRTYSVVDIEHKDDREPWDAKVPFDELPRIEVPVASLGPIAKKLHERITCELNNYFPSATDHQLIAMVCDPVMLMCAVPWLELNGYANDVERAYNLFHAAVLAEARRTYRDGNTNMDTHDMSYDDEVMPQEQRDDGGMAVVDLCDEPDDGSLGYSDDEDATYSLPIERIDNRHEETNSHSAESFGNGAFEAWTSQKIDFMDFLIREQGCVVDNKMKAKIMGRNWVYVAKLLNVQLWWKKNGHSHRLVERVAARELACPDSNALQERVFSLCKLIDSPLRQNLGNAKFEMLLVLAFNKEFIRSAESGSLLTTSGLVKALESAASATQAAATLIEFFDLDSNMDNDETETGLDIAETLRSAATVVDTNKRRAITSSSKKRRVVAYSVL